MLVLPATADREPLLEEESPATVTVEGIPVLPIAGVDGLLRGEDADCEVVADGILVLSIAADEGL
jgi:hypothetical protein